MRQVLNYITWGFLILLAAPTIMVVASWNSLPGDSLYSVKLGLEQVLFVLVSPSFATQGNLSVKYTERRFSDAKRLLVDKGSVEGLQYLDKQVTTTRDIIEKGNDAKTQAELAQKYIDTLTNLSAELTAQQQAMVGTGPSQQIQQTAPPAPQQVFVPPNQPTSGQQQAPSTQPQLILSPSTGGLGQPGPTQPQVQPAVRAPQNQLPPSSVITQVQAPIQRPAPQPVNVPPPPIVAAQISQTQANIAQTIKELEQVTKKSQQQEQKQEEKKEVPQAPQPQEQHKEEKGKGKEQ